MTPFTRGSKSLKCALLGAFVLAAMVLQVMVAQGASATHAYYEFVKDTITNSTLKWNDTGPNENVILTKSWRAGSGVNQDPCDKSTEQSPPGGWLPNGWYDLKGMVNTRDCCEIQGRAFELQNKACSDGTLREDLFIHTEETPNHGQVGCSEPGDDPHCWENDDDYKSVGCIKVKYSDPDTNPNFGISEFHTYFHNNDGGSSQHGSYTINSFILGRT